MTVNKTHVVTEHFNLYLTHGNAGDSYVTVNLANPTDEWFELSPAELRAMGSNQPRVTKAPFVTVYTGPVTNEVFSDEGEPEGQSHPVRGTLTTDVATGQGYSRPGRFRVTFRGDAKQVCIYPQGTQPCLWTSFELPGTETLDLPAAPYRRFLIVVEGDVEIRGVTVAGPAVVALEQDTVAGIAALTEVLAVVCHETPTLPKQWRG